MTSAPWPVLAASQLGPKPLKKKKKNCKSGLIRVVASREGYIS